MVARLFLSGQTTHLVSLARALARREHTVGVAASGRIDPAAWRLYVPELEGAGVACLRVANTAELEEAARRFSPDVIHCHSSDLLAAAVAAGERLAVPVVFTCHGLGVASSPAVRKAAAVIAVGPRVLGELQEAGVERAHLIGNGVDVTHFRPAEKERELTVAYVGRVDAGKRRGLDELAAAVAAIPRARLLVASNDRPAAPQCIALGWVHDVAPVMRTAHAVFGTGRAIREGMACGCVGFVLGRRYGGIVTPATLGRTAPEDRPFPSFSGLDGEPPDSGRLRLDLIRLWQDPRRRLRLARWSRTFACAHFSLDDVAERTLAVYAGAGAPCRPA